MLHRLLGSPPRVQQSWRLVRQAVYALGSDHGVSERQFDAMPEVPEELKKKLQKQHDEYAGEYQEIDQQLQKLAQNTEEYVRQKTENELVLKELQLLKDDANVFKQIGPCLIKQDMFEAKSNVEKRVEYISGELTRTEKQRNVLEDKKSKLRAALTKLMKDVERINQEASGKSQAATAGQRQACAASGDVVSATLCNRD
eukprot:TRINITY_DN15550_c0_g1_i1.p1 TRINITY_DN15550_c0_g1~~TRINITY_DN15550_c0_g1_i1.p1  ORF type:complete len:230 (-),score=18.12 TRINITY_DN15550_c0_g1_i1:348-944(-)